METVNFSVPLIEGYHTPKLTLTAILCLNGRNQPCFQVHNNILLTKQTFPKLISAVIRSYLIDMREQNQICEKDEEELEAKILAEVSELITSMKPVEKLDNPETS